MEKINENTWAMETEVSRFFVLEGSEKALMLDTGMFLPNARKLAEEITSLPLILLNTHGDPDHISGNGMFEEFYMHPKEEENYRGHGGTGTILPVTEDDVIDLGNRPLKIIEVPGHTPGSICVLDVDQRILFAGDVVQSGDMFMFGPQRDMAGLIESLKKLWTRSGEFDEIYSSHGEIPLKKEAVLDVIACAEKVFSGEAEGKEVNVIGQDVILYRFENCGFLCEK